MNKLFTLLLGASILFLTSCGGGWTEDQKNAVKNACITEGGYDCDCYVEKAVETFENSADFNEKTSALAEAFEAKLSECEVEEEAEEMDLESF